MFFINQYFEYTNLVYELYVHLLNLVIVSFLFNSVTSSAAGKNFLFFFTRKLNLVYLFSVFIFSTKITAFLPLVTTYLIYLNLVKLYFNFFNVMVLIMLFFCCDNFLSLLLLLEFLNVFFFIIIFFVDKNTQKSEFKTMISFLTINIINFSFGCFFVLANFLYFETLQMKNIWYFLTFKDSTLLDFFFLFFFLLKLGLFLGPIFATYIYINLKKGSLSAYSFFYYFTLPLIFFTIFHLFRPQTNFIWVPFLVVISNLIFLKRKFSWNFYMYISSQNNIIYLFFFLNCLFLL